MSCPYCTSEQIEKVKTGVHDHKFYCNTCGWFFDTPGPELYTIKDDTLIQLIAIRKAKVSFTEAYKKNGGKNN